MGSGVPMNGPGSTKEPMILKGIMMECPKCKGTENLWRNESVLRLVGIKPNEEGGYDWDNECKDEIIWDTSDKAPDEPEFFCRDCDIYFEAPNIDNELTGNADQLGSKKSA